MRTAELVKEQSPMIEPAHAPAGIKTILFHVHNDEALENRLQVALSLARAFGAHLHLLHVTPIQAYMVTDAFAVFVSREILDTLEDESAKLRDKLKQQLAKEDVSWDYEEITGEVLPRLVQRAALADLVITGRQPQKPEFGGPPIVFLGEMLRTIRTPLLVIGDEATEIDPFGPVIVAWNGSYEAANALRSAVPLLKISSKVRIVSVTEETEGQFPSTSSLEYLSRHGIHAELIQRPWIVATVEEQLIDQAAAHGASYIVMGGYSHSRAGEFIFGGVTRSLLKKCPVSLVMAR